MIVVCVLIHEFLLEEDSYSLHLRPSAFTQRLFLEWDSVTGGGILFKFSGISPKLCKKIKENVNKCVVLTPGALGPEPAIHTAGKSQTTTQSEFTTNDARISYRLYEFPTSSACPPFVWRVWQLSICRRSRLEACSSCYKATICLRPPTSYAVFNVFIFAKTSSTVSPTSAPIRLNSFGCSSCINFINAK